MLQSIYNEYLDLGLRAIPIEWDSKTKQPVSHRFWSETKPLGLLPKHNALMIHTGGHVHCLDFDIKNTQDKNLYHKWFNIIANQAPDILPKLYIERTRNAGYHVWFEYHHDLKKLALAESDKGSEVIALYAGGPLVYTYPTPGYEIVSGSMTDLQAITEEEFNTIIECSQYFNEYKPDYDPAAKAVSYPSGYESICAAFDNGIADDTWTQILAGIGLEPIPNHRYGKDDRFTAFRRRESESPGISAKVYYRTKRVMIFSASMHDYPNWHNKHEYPVWSLPPSFVLFYQHGRDWNKALETMRIIADSQGIELETPFTTDFPLHVFPDEIRRSIIDVCNARSLAPQFVATAGLWTVSSLAGCRYTSDFNGEGKNILFCLMSGPVSVGKTPAFKVMCDTPLQNIYKQYDRDFEAATKDWEERREQAVTNKQVKVGPKPRRYLPISNDGTTEGYISKSMFQRNGIGVYQDEAETIFNAGSFKNNNDSISFFTQAFSGGRTTQIRADEQNERVVPNLNLNLLMGTQPGRLKNIFTEDRLASGFASRFLIVESGYIELRTDTDPFSAKKEMCEQWRMLVSYLFRQGAEYNSGLVEETRVEMTEGAKALYRRYYREILEAANARIKTRAESYILGTEAKMSTYFPRLTQIIAILHDPRQPVITEQHVQYGWELYRYYCESTIRVISALHDELETGLPADLELLHSSLPEEFTRKEAAEICVRLNFKERRFDNAMRSKIFSNMFVKIGHGKYRKRY